MDEKRVRCDKCGKDATVVAVEGVLFPAQASDRPRIVLILDCPECGRREQPEKPMLAEAK